MKHFSIALLSLIIPAISKAAIVGPATNLAVQSSEKSQIVLDALWEELSWPADKAPAPSKKEQAKPAKKVVKKDPAPSPTPKKKIIPTPAPIRKATPKPTPTPKKLTAGQKKIQEMLRRNKERLKKMKDRQNDEEKEKRYAKKKAELNPFKKVDLNKSLRDLRNDGLRDLKNRQQQTLKSWKDKVNETYKKWREKREEFLKELPKYKENLFEFESAAVATPNNKLRRPLKTPVRNEYHLIPGAFDVPMRNQGRRPTCAAFAGVRAIETLLQGSEVEVDLSEQYFYWSSKPRCRQFPCSRRGSWVRSGFDFSKSASFPNIPTESSCPYQNSSQSGNETQVPLGPGCRTGKVKVTSYESLDTLDQMLKALNQNKPVIGGFKLSPNFYKTQGLVTYKDSLVRGKVDSHAKGHALLLVGHMKLPPKLAKTEGKICFITANSWGEGWGKGGFGCLTEKWMRNYRIPNAFIAVKNARYQ